MEREVKINLKVLNEVLTYLASQPYKDVALLIHSIKENIQEIKSEPTKTEQENS